MFKHVVFSTAYQHTLLHYTTSSPGCSSCRMVRMSGQSCVWEQGSGMEVSGGPSALVGVSFRTGKKVRWLQSCPASSSSSFTSAPTSHRIFSSVAKETNVLTRLTSKTLFSDTCILRNIFLYLCHFLFHFCSLRTGQSLDPYTASLAPVVSTYDTIKG